MGWYAVREALIEGKSNYGNVRQSLKGEINPTETMLVALDALDSNLRSGSVKLDRAARARVAYWRRWSGYAPPRNRRFVET